MEPTHCSLKTHQSDLHILLEIHNGFFSYLIMNLCVHLVV